MVTARHAAARREGAGGPVDTREKLVRTAERLMLRDGYSATRVDDVIAHARLSKGSFYHAFDSKEALGLAALEHYYADRVGRLAAGAWAAEADPRRRARAFLEHLSRVAAALWKDGCLLASFAAEAAGSSRAMAGAIRKRTGELRALLAGALAPLATPDAAADDLADQLLACIEGSIVLARIHDDASYLPRGVDRFRRCVDKGAGRG